MRLDALFYVPHVGPRLGAATSATGGMETQLALVTRELARRGRTVGLLAIERDDPLPTSVDGVRVIAQHRASRPPLLHPVTRSLALLRALRPTSTEWVVTSGTGAALLLVAAVARHRGWKMVYASYSRAVFEETARDSPSRWVSAAASIKLADRVVVQTEEQAQLCRSRYSVEPAVIPSIAETAPARTEAPAYFLWIGRVAAIKRPELFLELARRLPGIPFKMIAAATMDDEAPLAARLERAAAEIPNLELLEPRPRERLWPLLEGAAAVVNTSEHEGFPNIFLEAWARGIPALSLEHDPGGVIEREGLGGFAGGSMERLQELTRETWDARGEQSEVARRCREYVQREHSAESVAESWERVLWPQGLTP